MYLDHLQNCVVLGHGLLIFLFWHYFDLVKRVKFGVSGHFGRALWIFLIMVTIFFAEIGHIWGFWALSGERVGVNVNGRELPEIWYTAVSWPPSEQIRLWLRTADFSNFGAILT